jgi:hypothetical protein
MFLKNQATSKYILAFVHAFFSFKSCCWAQWFTPVIPAIWEVETGRRLGGGDGPWVQGQLRQKVSETLYQ